MTHEELLANVNRRIQYAEAYEIWKAVVAVVELHEPRHTVTPNEIYCDCGIGYLQAYPCPTIQAIEKELG
jgi:hypothetical protein